MLISFKVTNFLSFDSEVAFSMLPAKRLGVDDVHIAKGGRFPCLRMSALYGANASGKSNFISAIQFVKDYVIKGRKSGELPGAVCFALNEKADKSSDFEIVFRSKRKIYSYFFSVTKKMIEKEQLCVIGVNDFKLVFERTRIKDKSYAFHFGNEFFADGSRERQLMEYVSETTHETQLLLSESYEKGLKFAKPVRYWFASVLKIIKPSSDYGPLEEEIYESEMFNKYLSCFLHEAGTGIGELKARKITLDKSPGMEKLFSAVTKKKDSGVVKIGLNNREYKFISSKGEYYTISLSAMHGKGGARFTIPFDQESDGTKRLANLAPALFDLNKQDSVYFVDELERSLHPNLTKYFIEKYLSMASSSQCQFVFSTHDSNLLDSNLFRLDEVWLIDKDANGGSRLTSLVKYKIPDGVNLEKGYLSGRFGAVPILRIMAEQSDEV